MRKLLLITLITVLCHPLSWAPLGRPVHYWSLEKIAKEAPVVAVCQVEGVTQGERIEPQATRWQVPMRHIYAKLRVLRSFRSPEKVFLPDGMRIVLHYYAIEEAERRINAPCFPILAKGDIFVFPLQKNPEPSTRDCQLIDEEGAGVLIPALQEPFTDGQATTPQEFLVKELANCFGYGNYKEIFAAGRYLQDQHPGYYLPGIEYPRNWWKDLISYVEAAVQDDEDRWVDISVALLCSMGLQRWSIKDLLKGSKYKASSVDFAARALGNVAENGLTDRIIRGLVLHAPVHPWGSAVTLKSDFLEHLTLVESLTQSLKTLTPGSTYVAYFLAPNDKHPILPQALATSLKILHKKDCEFADLRAACELIRDYGSEAQFEHLLAAFRKYQKENRKRYRELWQGSAYTMNKRLIRICAIAITDKGACSKNLRFCDLATFQLERVTGVDFGIDSKQDTHERDKAVGKALSWLRENIESYK